MTTAIAVYNSDGCVGRCDARCHDATSADCDCICGGKNHGVGLQQAIANNHERVGLTPADLDRFAEAHGYKPADLKVVDRLATNARAARKQTRQALQPSIEFDLFSRPA